MSALEIILFVVTVLVLLPFTAFALAKLNLFWTLLETGNIKYIYKGDTLLKVIVDANDAEGKRVGVVDRTKLDPNAGKEKTWWQKKFGIYWIGPPPFASVKSFEIEKRKEVEDLGGRSSTEWIQDLGKKRVDSLRYAFPRPFFLVNVELQEDRQRVNLLVVCKFIVVDAYLPVPELKGEFFVLAGSILRGAIIDVVKEQMTMQKFLEVKKGEAGILQPLTEKDSEANKTLAQKTGLRLVGITISDWEPADQATRDAMSKAFIAEKEKEAVIIMADAYKERLTRETDADSARIKKLAVAYGKRVSVIRKGVTVKNGTPDEVIRATARITQADSLQQHLSTLVEGNAGIPVTLPVGGGEKK